MQKMNLKRTLTGMIAGGALMAMTVAPTAAQPSVPDVVDASSVADVAVSGAASIVGSAPAGSIASSVAGEGGQTVRVVVQETGQTTRVAAQEIGKTVRDLDGQ